MSARNHTGRAPDQEFWPGEGMFIGLGVNVRFPADFTQAPYSVLACSVVTSPQRVEFPFSLINSPTHVFPDLSPTLNQIIPAWVLTDTLYTLVRNRAQVSRSQSRPAHAVRFSNSPALPVRKLSRVLPPARIGACPEGGLHRRDIPGLGKNYLLEEVRGTALRGYRWFLRLDGLRRLQQIVTGFLPTDAGRARDAFNLPSQDPIWEAQRHGWPSASGSPTSTPRWAN